MRTIAVAVVGSKRSGKTTTVEALIKELTKRGHRVAAVKHISEQDFTIDTKGKDTWRYAQAGAKTIISIAADEIATVEKVSKSLSLEELLERCKGYDLVFLEGFKKLVSKKKTIPKIVVVRSTEEALEAKKTYDPIISFTGPYPTEKLKLKVPYTDALKNPEKLADLVENMAKEERMNQA
jgi:molybdopterin-guanine dinucleotide biosynthesis protein MobB